MQGDAKEEVRSRLVIEDIVGEYVQLKRAGRNFKGLSPFSGEKTPSFFVSPDKNIWHDFSSNKGGDVFAFIMEVEGMDFRQALEHLARKAGVELAQYENATSRELSARKKRLLDAHQLAARYYQQCLLRNRHAMDYVFGERGLDKNVVSEFQIGYAPDSGTALLNALTKKGFTKKELADAGLTNRYGSDMFRGRMMIPLMDASGQVIGFTGRIIGAVDGAPKYLNTSQTLIYDKSRQIFGLSQAKETIRRAEYIVVVEGNLDVVSSYQAGVRQTVATSGTAMTEHHLKAMKRLTGDVRLAYDGDKAGVAATERAIAMAAQVGVDLTIITLPDSAKDPDELIRRDALAWQRAIELAEPAVDWVLAQYSARLDISTATGKRAFTTAGLAVVRSLADAVERDHYERKIADMTGSSFEAVHTKLISVTKHQPSLKQVKNLPSTDATPDYPLEDNLLALAAIDAPSQELLTHMNIDLLHGEQRQTLARFLAQNHGTPLEDTPVSLQNYDTYVKIILLRADTRYAEWDGNDRYFETARLLRQIEHEYKKQTRDQLITELRSAESADDEATADRIRQELNTLIKEIARGKR
ncbi:MAG: DNA primase [Candidatus Saccharimonas sp.]|nr:DNA primase [Candidatus Saccharimonas sp.]